MGLLEVPVEPDVEALINCIRRQGQPQRVYYIELFLDEEIQQRLCERFEIGADITRDEFAEVKRRVQLHRFLGYDAFRADLKITELWELNGLSSEDTACPRPRAFCESRNRGEAGRRAQLAGRKRDEHSWMQEHAGPIQSWQDYEEFPWPSVSQIDFGPIEWLEKNLPENMGCYDLTAGILGTVTRLLGMESLCFKIFDEPELVEAVCQKVGLFYVGLTKTFCDFSCMKLVWGADDMGFRSGTLVSPDFLRERILPWHKKCADIAHEHGRVYLLHSCGNLEQIMDDLIDEVGIDAKHSYEDIIMPATQAKQRYGDRLGILGGIDMDMLCAAGERGIRRQVRRTLEICMPGGGYCLGTGNTVANYMPLENYLVMLDEGRNWLNG